MCKQLLQVDNVCKSYNPTLYFWKRGRTEANIIRNISFHIAKQQSVGLVGKSGCGKSTLARLLVRLESPDCGVIYWKEQDIHSFHKKSLQKFRKDCQLVHQDSLSSFNPMVKIKDSLLEPLKNHFLHTKEEGLQLIQSMLPQFHLNEQQLDRFPHELSGGQRQRFNILRALLVQPQLLICDEITTGLDKVTETAIIKLLKDLQKKTQMAILFISHDLGLIQQISEIIHVMDNGMIVESVEKENEQFTFQQPRAQNLFQSLSITHPMYRNIQL